MRPGRLSGTAVAALTAAVSGVSVFVNGYGVRAVTEPAVYTTAKNAVAAVLLSALAVARVRLRRSRSGPGLVHCGVAAVRRCGPAQRIGLAYVGTVGGGLAFVLFFDGLARTKPAPAAFWKDTLIIWVALMAGPLLRERLAWWNLAAIGLLISGQILVAGGVGRLTADSGESLVLCSSVLWAVEVVVVRSLLRHLAPGLVAATRMTAGSVTLLLYLLATGSLHDLLALDVHQVGWVVLTGTLLAVYVATWLTALARARAVDVTSILVASAPFTWLLQVAFGTESPTAGAFGLLLIGAGATGVVWAATRSSPPRRRTLPV